MTLRPTTDRPTASWRRRVIAAPAAGQRAPARSTAQQPPRPATPPPSAAPSAAIAAPGFGARLADRVAGLLLGAEESAYRGQLPGATGRIANRLGKGESVMLAATGTAAVPAALVATWLPGGAALPDLAGSLRMAGMLARKNDGKLLLTLTLQAAESASKSLGGGISAGLTLGARRYGFKLGAERSVGGELAQVVVVTLKFDPKDPADARRLRDLLEPDVAGLIDPFAPRLQGGTALQRALAHNRQTVSLGGSLGGNVGLTLGGNLGELDPTDGQGVAADSPWSAKAKLALVGSASGELFRSWAKDGSVSDMVGFEAGVEGAVKLPAIVRGKVSDRAASAFNVTRDAQGQVSGLAAVFTDAVVVRGFFDLPGADLGAKAAVKVVRTRALTEPGLVAARALIAAGASPLAAYKEVALDPALVEESTATVGQRTLMAGFDAGVTLGGQRVGLVGLLAGGKMARSASDDADPGLRELLAVMKGTLATTRM